MFGKDRDSLPDRIGFFLIPNFSMMAFTSAVEPLRQANRVSGQTLYEWYVLSKDGSPVAASNGVSVSVDLSIAEVAARGLSLPTILTCTGLNTERYVDREVFTWLRRLDRQGVQLGALCTGAYVLARAGLLDGHRCTIHWENLPAFREQFPEIEASSDLFEIDGNRFSCSGGTAPLDMMLYLITEQHGAPLATKVSEAVLLDRIRGARDHQRLPLRVRLGVHHPKLLGAIEMMEANLEEPLSQDELAHYVGLSRRQLERLFRKYLGRAPGQYYLELRLDRARHLLYQTDLAIIDVALACGFVSASHFSKCYRQLYGRTPRAERTAAA
jgi:transcriptional regulator GlxA family with amidase domain